MKVKGFVWHNLSSNLLYSLYTAVVQQPFQSRSRGRKTDYAAAATVDMSASQDAPISIGNSSLPIDWLVKVDILNIM